MVLCLSLNKLYVMVCYVINMEYNNYHIIKGQFFNRNY